MLFIFSFLFSFKVNAGGIELPKEDKESKAFFKIPKKNDVKCYF